MDVKAKLSETVTPCIAGEYVFRGENRDKPEVMVFCCPCGCGDLGRLQLRAEDREIIHPSWE